MVDLITRQDIDWSLVKGVSRSFYLTLRLLPRAIQSTVTLAYLLARASDTIADNSAQAIATRLQVLQTLRSLAQGAENIVISLDKHQLRTSPAEQRLLEQLPDLLKQLKIHPDGIEIRQVWSLILEGQIFDLTHSFALPLSREQLDRYTFLVAGCVGKFWTQVCWKRIPRFASLPIRRMEELGIDYGKGLQLINILRDRQEDASRGRIYLSQESVPESCVKALQAMRAGADYAAALRPPLLRYATVLPALIGVRTLELIRSESGIIKISRAEVRRILIAALPCLWNAQLVKRLVDSFTFRDLR
ncbi:MAG: hypothetical protein C5B47_08155 [Verrucomicrobia bacterium]|nr:MAG: hypothetical protein C5B47_08155 [Verrucomicrobiota bacterium]